MKRFISVFGFAALLSTSVMADKPRQELRMLETSEQFADVISREYANSAKRLSENTILVPKSAIGAISELSHELTNRCGGFLDITDEASNTLVENGLAPRKAYELPALNTRKEPIARAIETVQAGNVRSFVETYYGNFKTRNAGTAEGERAPQWLAKLWQDMADKAGVAAKVELVTPPRGYKQANVRVTIPGTDPSLPAVIIGGHLDSINWREGDGAVAPGADDNASGIGALTEAYRVLLASGLKPKATVQIFGYAAEELGLLGSRAVAESYQHAGTKVRAVLQLDMVAFPGNAKKVTFITDNVNRDLTTWTEQLYGLYLGGEVQEEACGYGCSDHASWTRYGYASVFPFEAVMDDMNHRIHTSRDVWDASMNTEYASQFAALAFAFVAELSEAQ